MLDDPELDASLDVVAERFAEDRFFLFLGRHLGLPVCLEGALKLKEISYIPTDAYPAGEMKHGPIALLADDTPVVAVATDSHVYEKVVSNLEEVRARGAHVIAVATEGNVGIDAPRGGRPARAAHDARAPAGARRDPAPAPRPTASRGASASTSTSRATWPRPSPSSSRAERRSRRPA